MHVEVRRLFFTTPKQYQKFLLDCVSFTKGERAYVKHCINEGAKRFTLYVTSKEKIRLQKMAGKRKVARIRHHAWEDVANGVEERRLHS
jgi:hypothetical protein